MTQDLVPAISDDELTALALAASPDVEPAEGAPSFWDLTAGGTAPGLLPGWYMPVSAGGVRRLVGWRRAMAWGLVVAFVAIDAVGLCTTYGPIVHL